jgi:hypothetical protein
VSDDQTLEIKSFIKRLAPDQLGLFEPLSGIMLLNVEEEEFQAMAQRWAAGESTAADVGLIATINHETYHFAQTAASGYMHQRQRAAFRALNEAPAPEEPELDPELKQIFDIAREAAGDDPEANARLDASLYIVTEKARQEQLEARAAAGDHSLAGAAIPDFFAFLEQRRATESVANDRGISILGVIEGSAVIFANLLMYGDDAAAHVREELVTLPLLYGELLDFTVSLVGDRALRVALPAAAVALCYEAPQYAYCELVPMVAAAPDGEELARGQELFESPPALESAGAWLGDAIAQRAADDSYRIYDTFLEELRSDKWGVDSYALMADPQAMHRVGFFPLGFVTRTGWRAGTDRDTLVARMFIMGIVLQSLSRRRAQRDFEKLAVSWAQGVFSRFVGESPPPETSESQ